MCPTFTVHKKDDATKAFSAALSLSQANCKKMLRYLAALFVFVEKLKTMAHGQLPKEIMKWFDDHHLNNGLAYHEINDVELIGASLLWALNLGPAPHSKSKAAKESNEALPDAPFKVHNFIC